MRHVRRHDGTGDCRGNGANQQIAEQHRVDLTEAQMPGAGHERERNRMRTRIIAAALFFVAGTPSLAQTASPYAGQESREIKSLTGDEIAGYLSGKGMGLAKAA